MIDTKTSLLNNYSPSGFEISLSVVICNKFITIYRESEMCIMFYFFVKRIHSYR